MEYVETLIIGCGQAGLAMSYHLSRLGREHIILERARLAERWRTQRWDSLMFQFPNWSIELPGRGYSGSDPDGFSHRSQVIEFIEGYSEWIKAPVRLGMNVVTLRPAPIDGRYRVATERGELEARNVIIATGPYQRPQVPPLASALPPDLVQVHSGDYRNPAALPAGAVLVIGSGASGCQIAEELVQAGRRVYFSIGRHRRVPRRYRGRDVFWWRRALGHLDQTAEATPEARRMHAPLVTGVRGGHDIDIRRYTAWGMTLLGHVLDVRDGRIALAPDLEDSLAIGDRTFIEFRQAVDEYVRNTGMDAALAEGDADPGSAIATPRSPREIEIRAAGIRSVIWATGYSLDFGWVEVPIFDALGRPVHLRGVTAAPGVYLLGLAWLHKAKSSFLYGVGEDAEYLAVQISQASAESGQR